MKMNYLRILNNQQFRFLAIGGWNTLVGCSVFALLYYLFSGVMHYLVVAMLSHVVAVFNSWLAYRWIVFHSHNPWFPEYLRFNLSSLIVLGFNIFGLWVMVDFLGFHPVISQVVLIVLVVIFSYLMHANFSFDDQRLKEHDAPPH